MPNFYDFVKTNYPQQKQSGFYEYFKQDYMPKLQQKPLITETMPPEVKGRISGLEATQQKQFLNDYMGLVRHVASGVYKGVSGLTDVLDKGAGYIAKRYKVPKGHLFSDINKKARELAEFQRMQGIGGVPGKVASGLGEASVVIPQFMALGEWGLPIHGALTGLAEEEPIKGAVKGGLQGALIHGTLGGIAQLPSPAQLPAFLGFGVATTPGGVEDRTVGGLTWAALGMTGQKRGKAPSELINNFVDAYPSIKNKITAHQAENMIMRVNPKISRKAIQQAGGAKVIFDKSMELAKKNRGVTKDTTELKQAIQEKGWENSQAKDNIDKSAKNIKLRQIEQKIIEGGTENLTTAELDYLKKQGILTERKMGEMSHNLDAYDVFALDKKPTDAELKEIEKQPDTEQNIKELYAGYPLTKELPELAKTIKQIGQVFTDVLYVEPQFKRIGAPETGIVAKSIPSRRNADFEKYEQFLKDINKRFNLTDEDYMNLTWATYSEKDFNQLSQSDKLKFAEPARLFREYYNKWKVDLQKAGALGEGFPDNVISHLREERTQKNAMLKRGKVSNAKTVELRKEVKEINTTIKFLQDSGIKFVHIPRTWLEGLFQKDAVQARKVISEFFHKRKTLDMRQLGVDLWGKGILKDRDLDLRYITGAYTHQASWKKGLGELFRTAEKEGIVDITAKQHPDWVSLFSREFPSMKGKAVHPILANYIQRNIQRNSKIPGKAVRAWTSLMGTTKMLQFYNPIFLPMYDVYQAWWTGSVRSRKTPTALAKALKSIFKKDDAYWNMHYWGGFSTPFTPGFDELLKRVERTVGGHDIWKRAKKYINPYQFSWKAAWTGDHAIRLITYHYYLKKGLTPQEAAQLTAKAHGDYANVPTATRTLLNKILFTPTFKLTMMEAQAEMVTSMGKYINPTRQTTRSEKEKAKMLVGLASGIFLREWFMHKLGFKTDKFGLKYTKNITTDEGQKKQMVLHVATPDNVVLRLLHRFKPTDMATVPDKFKWFFDRAKWELHPMYQWALEVGSNKSLDFEPIYNPFDSPTEISKDVLNYTVRRLIPYVKIAFPKKEGNKVDAMKQLQKDYGSVALVLQAFTLPYTRNSEESQMKYKINRFISTFQRFQREAPPKTEEEAQRRVDGFRRKLIKMRKELLEAREE